MHNLHDFSYPVLYSRRPSYLPQQIGIFVSVFCVTLDCFNVSFRIHILFMSDKIAYYPLIAIDFNWIATAGGDASNAHFENIWAHVVYRKPSGWIIYLIAVFYRNLDDIWNLICLPQQKEGSFVRKNGFLKPMLKNKELVILALRAPVQPPRQTN